MVRIGKVRVAVRDRLMKMRVAVTRARCDRRLMRVVVVHVARAMDVYVRVLQALVHVGVFVAFRQMQGHTDRHQCAGCQ